MEGFVASAKGVVGEGGEARVSEWVEIVRFSDFCKDAGQEVMLGHVQEVAEAGKQAESVSDVVGVGRVGEHKGGLKSRSVGEAMSRGTVVEVDKEFS